MPSSQPCENPLPQLGHDVQNNAASPNAERRSVQQLTMRRFCSRQSGHKVLRRSLSQKSILPRRLEMQWSGRAHAGSEGESELTEREFPRLRLSGTRACVPSGASTCHTVCSRTGVRQSPTDPDDYTTPVPIKRRATVGVPEPVVLTNDIVARPLRWSTPVPGMMTHAPQVASGGYSLAPVNENVELLNPGVTPVGEPTTAKELASDEPVNRKRHREDESTHCRKLHCRH
eukprot:Gregarina_sp_Poly_1__11140@NODE_902_length_5777_cov_93_573030_g644_i0_p4_GENE_NODE_902_length_5777_cov_93_573030_g644_i0NODE_902_length_5777_cov_93_573030_g644_i0_p4_ORF_typecomplete_len230_score27_43_NODE_902_length_5777_cov_93_573030_g644_i049265615